MITSTQWSDLSHRDIGYVDWAPKISVDVAGRRFTIDLATFVLDPVKFKLNLRATSSTLVRFVSSLS